ncbi:MAG: choice-of-anchor Q domain-containing protein [Ignavibacteriaceae bacterium]|jgi:parallel beta-helix repeat protein|nr:choice-of-anchor Q domain-containing protein [Ignavibacteriaceae bacterium]
MNKSLLFLFLGILVLTNIHTAFAHEIIVSNLTELQNAINNVQGGDTISLPSGSYGNLIISGKNNNSTVTIRAIPGATSVFTSVRIQNSSYWELLGVNIEPRYTSGADGKNAVVLDGNYLTVRSCIINYSDDITGWSKSTWLARAGNGIEMDGANLKVIDNTITVVDHGIGCGAANSIVSGNLIANFRGDGIRGLADDVIYEYNIIKNSFEVDDNHDDGFQSWSYGSGGVGTGVVKNVVLRGNTIINYEDPNQPFKSNLQGIGLFDGMFENWVVENNLVITNHWHGISFYGAINCKIINNTVVDNDLTPSPDPWIMVTDHKNGTPSSGVIVRNNIATDFSFSGGVTEDHNIEITMNNASTYLINPSGGTGNYHLKPTSPAIDAGSDLLATVIDKDGIARPQGSAFDIGCYEFNTLTSVNEDVLVSEFALYQNYPNPFNPTTKIKFTIPQTENHLTGGVRGGLVTLKVYDILGNKVATLLDEYKPAGSYEVNFMADGLTSGVYIYQLTAPGYRQARKMILAK